MFVCVKPQSHWFAVYEHKREIDGIDLQRDRVGHPARTCIAVIIDIFRRGAARRREPKAVQRAERHLVVASV